MRFRYHLNVYASGKGWSTVAVESDNADLWKFVGDYHRANPQYFRVELSVREAI